MSVSGTNSNPLARAFNTVQEKVGSLVSRSNAAAVQTTKLNGHTLGLQGTAQQPARSTGLGDRIASFLTKLSAGASARFEGAINWMKDRLARSETAQAPATPAPKTAAETEIAELKDTTTWKLFQDKIDPKRLNDNQRGDCAYAYAKREGDKAERDPAAKNNFLRSDNNASKISARIAMGSPQFAASVASIANRLTGQVFASSAAAYGADGQEPTHAGVREMKDMVGSTGVDYRTAIALQSVQNLDDTLCELFGTPGDDASIHRAAERVPQELCNQLAILHRAIEDSRAVPGDVPMLKMQCSRDALALRTLNPAIMNASSASEDKAQAENLKQISKSIQNIVNGLGIGMAGKDTAPEMVQAGAGMKARWDPTFAAFADAVVRRADPLMVNGAASEGGKLEAENARILARIGELQGGNAAGV
ncbi:hypothetical protein [Aureimonas leprariae]|uniref:Uncharacterized protein n=1 Tax=Plantimonas leprariae TaxID=2615207 RepID=A0A7V7TUY4_9HYPH|nr:hypothetical protein [Aureimonas leprariae]KAB0676871.1 hypothetical protein F6X38_20080 [Aureimonas leprariae]